MIKTAQELAQYFDHTNLKAFAEGRILKNFVKKVWIMDLKWSRSIHSRLRRVKRS